MPFYFLPSENALPPKEVKFTRLAVDPWPDGRRVKVSIELTPFQSPPSLVLLIKDHQSREVSRILFVEAQETVLSFTIHLRQAGNGEYSLNASINYPDLGEFNPTVCHFSISGNVMV